MVAYSTPMTPPPMTVSVRGRRSSCSISSLSKMRLRSNGTFFGRCGRVPTEISALAKPASDRSPVSAMRATELGPVKRASALRLLTALRMNWCCKTSTSWSSVLCRRWMRSPIEISCLTRYPRP